jgi:hypothetical protein
MSKIEFDENLVITVYKDGSHRLWSSEKAKQAVTTEWYLMNIPLNNLREGAVYYKVNFDPKYLSSNRGVND